MNNAQLILSMALILRFSLFETVLNTWGFYPHKIINRHAIFTLPPAMITFYKHHINYLSEQAVAADHRRYAVAEEGARHYIDLDYYGADVSRSWDQVIEVFPWDSIQEHGILPWHLMAVKSRLVQAFKANNVDRVLKISADAGHYLADAHVPLHTTSNYNGQKSGQRGIHGFWETRVPELLINEFDLWVGKASYRANWQQAVWDIIMESHSAVDSVLLFEKELSNTFPDDQKYSYEVRLSRVTQVYSKEFTASYHHVLNTQVEKRMRASIRAVGDFWYSCWVEAGQPDLTGNFDKLNTHKSDYQNVADSIWRSQHRMRR